MRARSIEVPGVLAYGSCRYAVRCGSCWAPERPSWPLPRNTETSHRQACSIAVRHHQREVYKRCGQGARKGNRQRHWNASSYTGAPEIMRLGFRLLAMRGHYGSVHLVGDRVDAARSCTESTVNETLPPGFVSGNGQQISARIVDSAAKGPRFDTRYKPFKFRAAQTSISTLMRQGPDHDGHDVFIAASEEQWKKRSFAPHRHSAWRPRMIRLPLRSSPP